MGPFRTPLLACSILLSLGVNARILSSPKQLAASYDFIIVGGGTAGSVIANRLTEVPDVTVLVIEAGGSNDGVLAIEVPFLAVTLPGTAVDWNFTSTAQPGLGDRILPYTRGRVLGGSSNLNLLTYNRGSNSVWDRWAALTEDIGWSWPLVEPYYLKSSRLVPPSDGHNTVGEVNPLVHGNGPVEVSVPSFPLAVDNLVINSSKVLGGRFRFNEDMNAGDFVGVGTIQNTVGGGERSSAATAYLATPVVQRKNLDILLNTQVTKLLSSGSPHSAPVFQTVEFAQSATGPRSRITARKEVILSAGVFGTPQLLLLSGVGPRQDLKSHSIQTILDIPDVGQQLTDHPFTPVYFSVSSTSTWDDVLRNTTVFDNKLSQWEATQQGLFTDSPGNTLGFFRLPDGSPLLKGIPDPSAGPNSGHTEIIFFDAFVSFGPISQPPTGNFLTLLSAVVSPTSRGSVTLNSTDPFAKPNIDPALLSTDFDIEAIVQVMKDAETFMKASPWKSFNPTLIPELANATTDAAKAAFARANAATVNHPAGTARMSPATASWGVVDSQLRLKGATGLRIVDASIFPAIPECHIQGVVYIVAERAADLIKLQHGLL